MSAPGLEPRDLVPKDARAVLQTLPSLELERYVIVGGYVRYDERTRSTLKELRQKVTESLLGKSLRPANFLLWGSPGSGKSYLVREIAESIGEQVSFRELNLAQLDESGLRAGLDALVSIPKPVLCFIDEVDSKPGASWPYEVLLPYLEPATPRSHSTCYCLAGSGGDNLPAMAQRIQARPKGRDLLSRIPRGHEFVVDSLGVGDKMLVAASQLVEAAAEEGRPVREIEKLALYYIATHPGLTSARQLRSLAIQTARRIPPGEDRIKYDSLFAAGDPENKEFWTRSPLERDLFANRFVHVSGGTFPATPRASVTGPPVPAVKRETPPIDARRIVVLPFANISPDPHDEYFADGMTEELIEKLAGVSGLKVIARTTSMHYKGSNETALEIGRELGTGCVVECSVRKAGNRVRITAQLIDTASEEHLWASRYDRELDDIFAIQDEIAGHIAGSISARITSVRNAPTISFVPGKPDTHHMLAYTDFLRGVKLLGDRGSEATIRQALEFFEDAVRLDPQFARARVGIAESLLWLGSEGAVPLAESKRRAREELSRALAQNEALAEAHSVLAGLLVGEDDMTGAEREARRAVELNPSLSDPYRWLAQLAAGNGKIIETVRLLETANQINPLDVNVLAFLGRAYMYAGREADALAHWARTKSLIPFRTNSHLVEYYLASGRYAEAEETLREMERLRPESLWTKVFRGILAAQLGKREEAREIINELRRRGERGEMTVFFVGFVQYALGDQDAFVASMERAFELHSLPLLELAYSRLYESARKDPRIIELLKRQADFRTPAG
jgi:adenylate cyclase